MEGLAFLEDVIGSGTATAVKTARNLATSYAARVYGRIDAVVSTDLHLPEPELEHFFKVLLAFDPIAEALPESARELKIEVARRLVDRYYEGHSPEQKQEALDALNALGKPEEH